MLKCTGRIANYPDIVQDAYHMPTPYQTALTRFIQQIYVHCIMNQQTHGQTDRETDRQTNPCCDMAATLTLSFSLCSSSMLSTTCMLRSPSSTRRFCSCSGEPSCPWHCFSLAGWLCLVDWSADTQLVTSLNLQNQHFKLGEKNMYLEAWRAFQKGLFH